MKIDFYFRNVTHQYFELEGEVKGDVRKPLKKAYAVKYLNGIKKKYGDDLLADKLVETNDTYSVYFRLRMDVIVNKFIMPNF